MGQACFHAQRVSRRGLGYAEPQTDPLRGKVRCASNTRRGAAPTFMMHSFDMDLLAGGENMSGLATLNLELVS